MHPVPELLAPAGSLDAVRAALANGADSVYLGASRFNARDEGAQLTLDELEIACRMAHSRQARIYLTLNVLVKPAELEDALTFLGEAIDRGIDAAIVQDLGLMRLIHRVYPGLEVHGSTQTTVHDVAGARVMARLGVDRVVLARENTLEDIRTIRSAVPELGLETFVHGALCIAYSGQCFMSGMISERSANRGSCAQSCRKDYVLRDVNSGAELDRGYLISARDLAAHEHLPSISDAGIACLKVEGRKKKPEYVAIVTRTYRDALDRIRTGESGEEGAVVEDPGPLVQIYSRGFTGGMYGGRVGRDYVTRTQPDHRGVELGVVTGYASGELMVSLSKPVDAGDGLAFEPPDARGGPEKGFAVRSVRTIASHPAIRQAISTTERIPAGWRVLRTSQASLTRNARATFQETPLPDARRARLDVRVSGHAGSRLTAVFSSGAGSSTVHSDSLLVPASARPLSPDTLRTQLGRLGDTRFVLGSLDATALDDGLFLPVSELNRIRVRAVEEISNEGEAARSLADRLRADRVRDAVMSVEAIVPPAEPAAPVLSAQVFTVDDALAAADAGATEICFDPFLRHPAPPLSRVRKVESDLESRGIAFRLRLPTIVRPADRRAIRKWLDAPFAFHSGHLGMVAELAESGRNATADYAVNVFNQHTAAELFALGAQGIVLSVELTAREMQSVVRPWQGAGFGAVVYGRPEGMTLEHCVLSAAFDREVTTCRDLCTQKHADVTLTDPAGYSFAVATDYACRNRLLHSRPIDGSEYMGALWNGGIRTYHLLFNVAGDPVADIVSAFRRTMDRLKTGEPADRGEVRALLRNQFTRGHFARAV